MVAVFSEKTNSMCIVQTAACGAGAQAWACGVLTYAAGSTAWTVRPS